jgi:hypothetical protein
MILLLLTVVEIERYKWTEKYFEKRWSLYVELKKGTVVGEWKQNEIRKEEIELKRKIERSIYNTEIYIDDVVVRLMVTIVIITLDSDFAFLFLSRSWFFPEDNHVFSSLLAIVHLLSTFLRFHTVLSSLSLFVILSFFHRVHFMVEGDWKMWRFSLHEKLDWWLRKGR